MRFLGASLLMAIFLSGCAKPKEPPVPWSRESLPQEKFPLRIHPLCDFNLKTKEQFFQLRMDALREEPRLSGLIPPDYAPERRKMSERIDFTKPWVGLVAQYFCNDASLPQRFSEGLSVESGIWNNPYFLMSLRFYDSYKVSSDLEDHWSKSPEGIQPMTEEIEPVHAEFDGLGRRITLDYHWYFNGLIMNANKEPYLCFAPLNARDLGLTYYAVLSGGSQGFQCRKMRDHNSNCFDHIFTAAAVLRAKHQDFLKSDANGVGYPSGDGAVVIMDSLPARMEIAFWKDRPSSLNTPPDFHETIRIFAQGKEDKFLPLGGNRP